ncbi:MAG: hypothetical protein ABJL17_16445 [Parvibaculum sp.]|uniref:hypothetical protein n=1 Tax=Parvibaculum sp. TaxID=2024848 RepID=UPI003266DB4D
MALLSERELVEIRVRAEGTDAVSHFRAEIAKCEKLGDEKGRLANLERLRFAEEYIAQQVALKRRLATTLPDDGDLFGGIANASIQSDEFDFGGGVVARKTYAHVMAPFLAAFERARPGSYHPGPLKAVGGGIAFDVELEIVVPRSSQPTGFDRLNTIWWLAALLRMLHPSGLRVPVVANMSFAAVVGADSEPKFWPVEMTGRGLQLQPSAELPVEVLEWVAKHYVGGERLMRDSAFSLAFQALDASLFVSHLGSSKLLLWAALEALFRPGRHRTTHRLSAAIATYLVANRSDRDREYDRVKRLYEARGQVTHAAEVPDVADVAAAFRLAQACFTKVLELGQTPDIDALTASWKTR